MVPFSFCFVDLCALPEGGLFHPASASLLLADLHLEKASWYATGGQFLPPYDSEATLAAVTTLVDRCDPLRLLCLGDSFHDPAGCERLGEEARAMLIALTSRLDWVWIVGNHDPGFSDLCGGSLADELDVRGIQLRHAAERDDPRPEISGHFHPKLRLNLHGSHVSRRCFVATATKLIMPAFGSLTGGLDAGHPEILRSVGSPASALVPVSDRLLRFPIAA
jgi:DNA ligase-associated metallophosphoesterase